MALSLRLLRGAISTGASIYVDSVGGNDANPGTLASPLQTLGAATTAITALGNGSTLRLKCGSIWRETLNLSSLTGITVSAYSTGAAPIVAGCDIQTGWTNDGTHTNLWYKDVAHNSTFTNRQVVIDNDALMNRVASAATANTTPGAYYSADCGSANPVRVYIHPNGTNPNSNGHVYEVSTRTNAIFLGANATLTGVVAKAAISNNGSIETGHNAYVSRCVAAFGTKHNMLVPSGLIEDCVFADADAPSASEPGVIPLVIYANDLRGYSCTLRRGMFYNNRQHTEFVFSHTQSDPTNRADAITIEQSLCYMAATGGGSGVGGSADTFTVQNCSFNGNIYSIALCGGDAISYTRIIGETRADYPSYGSLSAGTLAISQCAASRNTVAAGGKCIIEPLTGQTITVTNFSFLTPSTYFAQALGYFSNTNFTISLNNCVIGANNGFSKPVGCTLGSTNNNVYVRPSGGIGPFNTWQGTAYNLSSAMAGWRTASGQDAASIALTTSPFTGTPANGDFRVDGTALGQGVTEYWDFNTRAVVAGQPTRWPVGPRTWAESLTYISDPTAWSF